MKSILKSTFWQLAVVYSVFVILISVNLFWKYTLHFEIFAVLLGIIGWFLIENGEKENKMEFNKYLHYSLFVLAIVLIFVFRFVPYASNQIPLGYDAGIYKYGIENFFENGFGMDKWVKGALEPGFLYFMFVMKLFFSTDFILTWLLILFSIFLGISVYFFAKEYFNKGTGIIALLIYSVSAIQFKVFELMYYKNIIALSLLLWSLWFLKRNNRLMFISFAVLVGIFHRPTFFIFGLSYIIFVLCRVIFVKKEDGKNRWIKEIIDGLIILDLSLVFYIGFIEEAILPLIYPVAASFISPGNSSGTFVSFFSYQFSTLAYLPLSIVGFLYLLKKKEFNMLFFWTVINVLIVYFQFFFFNRFIIHLDIALIILAGKGFSLTIEKKRIVGYTVLTLLLFSTFFVGLQEVRNAGPLISEYDLDLIREFRNVEKDASVMSISSEYSPGVLAYSGRKTIAPGLFDENVWSETEWHRFWNSKDKTEIMSLLSVYERPIYLFAGTKKFSNPCFKIYSEKNGGKIYKYEC